MKDALLHIHDAIEELRRLAGPPTVISILEDVQTSLMHNIFGTPSEPKLHHPPDDRRNSDWTLGPDEPMPHHGQTRLSLPEPG